MAAEVTDEHRRAGEILGLTEDDITNTIDSRAAHYLEDLIQKAKMKLIKDKTISQLEK